MEAKISKAFFFKIIIFSNFFHQTTPEMIFSMVGGGGVNFESPILMIQGY